MLHWIALFASLFATSVQDATRESTQALPVAEAEAIRPAHVRLRNELYVPSLDKLSISYRDLEILVRDIEGEPVAGAAVALSGPSLLEVEGSPLSELRPAAQRGPEWRASVWRAKAPAGSAELTRLSEFVDPTANLRASSWRTDASGRLTLPIPESGRILIAAGHGGRVGMAEFDDDASPTSSIEIVLRQTPSIEVSVATQSGRALADVPIGIVAATRSGADKGVASRLLAHTRTDAHGRARLRCASDVEADKQRFETAEVTLMVAGYEHLGVRIESIARASIELVVPEPAWLEVTREKIGKRHTVPIAIALVGAAAPLVDTHTWAPRGYDVVELPTSGSVTMGPIGPGADIRIFATLTSQSWFGDERQFDVGARFEPGERRSFTLSEVAPPPTLEAQLVRADGTPDANRQIWVEHREPPFDNLLMCGVGEPILWTPPTRLTTDDEGRFELTVTPGWLHHDSISQLTVWSADPNVASSAQASMLTIQSLLGVAHLDLGFIDLRADDFIASGRVVDEQGRGIYGIEISARTARPAQGVFRIPSTREPDLDGELSLAIEWRDCLTDADGRFRLRGPATHGPIWLKARDRYSSPRFIPAELHDFERGSTGLEIVMSRRSSIVGSLSLPAGTAVESLTLRVKDADGRQHSESRVDQAGRFELGGLLPGEYEVQLETYGGFLVQKLGSHLVFPRIVSRPDRLDDVALDTALYHFTFDVPAGHPFPDMSRIIEARPTTGSARWRSLGWLRDGHALRCSLPYTEIEVRMRPAVAPLIQDEDYEHLGVLTPGTHWVRP